MVQVAELKTEEDWKRLRQRSVHKPVLLLKHSTRCPISAEAYDQFLKQVNRDASSAVDYALVLVVEQRPVSNAVAEELGVKHESPQAILVRDGAALWHISHWRITADALQQQVSQLLP